MTSDDLNKPPSFKGYSDVRSMHWFSPSFHPSHAFDTQGSQRLDDIHRQGTYQATGIGRKGVEGIRRLLAVWRLPRLRGGIDPNKQGGEITDPYIWEWISINVGNIAYKIWNPLWIPY